MAASDCTQVLPRIVRSPAKLNLFLEVTGRRADGFHELETVMVRTDVCDTLMFHVQQDKQICLSLLNPSCDGIHSAAVGFPLDDSNLIVQAAQALQKLTGCSLGAQIHVHKLIPGQAGLGGGSSNAAVTLNALNELWKLNLSSSVLHKVAASVGSDVNFLLSGYRAALCTGRGEQIHALHKTGTQHGVLLVPAVGNSTSEIFQALGGAFGQQKTTPVIDYLSTGIVPQDQVLCFNRLQSVAEKLNPAVSRTLSWLKEKTGAAHLTGSGSGCFSLVSSAVEARRLARRFKGTELALATAFRI